ncbi:hypothetical protein AGMMS50276_03660 [Synergistales bacterium]|nr:hypothetical protein AGMMS50276_03660 [Synergistales bacterium]
MMADLIDFNGLRDLNGDGIIDELDFEIANSILDGGITEQDFALAATFSDADVDVNADTNVDADIAAGVNADIGVDIGADLDASAGFQNISFGSSKLSPRSWDDGVSYSEITPDAMESMFSSIMEMFGDYNVNVYRQNGIENALATMGDSVNFVYDPNFLWSVGQQHGPDAITGLAAHEVGHRIVEDALGESHDVSSWHHELCSDFVSGIVSELQGVDHNVMHNMFADSNFSPASPSHPNGGLRAEAYDMGVGWARNHSNEAFMEFLLEDSGGLASLFESNIIKRFPSDFDEYLSL